MPAQLVCPFTKPVAVTLKLATPIVVGVPLSVPFAASVNGLGHAFDLLMQIAVREEAHRSEKESDHGRPRSSRSKLMSLLLGAF